MDDSMDGQVAIVTGGGSGLGEAIVGLLAREGVHVVVADIDEAKAVRVALAVGGTAVHLDVADPRAVDSVVDAVTARHGRLDIMVNNAGIAPPNPGAKGDRMIHNQVCRMEGRIQDMVPLDHVLDLDDAEWDRMIRVHLYGVFHGTRAALRHMQVARSGRIVNMSSVLGLRPAAGAPHYSAAKAAIIAFTKSVADEVAPLGINVNAVCPGYIDTPLLTPFSEILRAGITMRIGKGHMGSADDVAAMVRFLCGPESSYCTGDVFSVSGGYTG
jgi:NAD(P)-dependent dehydrogenase (short-subunit alcohol dehydrogenase family)